MAAYRLEDVLPLTLLKEAYGEEVILEEGSRETAPYRILAEFSVDGGSYAVLQTAAMAKEDEVEIFRILSGEEGSLELENVEDDEEWENLAELYDEMTVSFD
jgi:uncharacterized protein YrzB (UPF0473 family)